MGGMNISSVGAGGYEPSRQVGAARQEQKALVEALREEREGQPDVAEMMKEAREKAAEREKMFKRPKSSRRYGDTTMIAYTKLARAKSLGDVDAASGYARRQIAINQLQKAVNRAGRKKREISQEKLTAKRQAKLEKEKRAREAKRLRHQLRSRQAARMIRESGYLREAEIDNRMQDHIAATKQEMRTQMQELTGQTQTTVDAAIQQYAAASAGPAPEPEINVQA